MRFELRRRGSLAVVHDRQTGNSLEFRVRGEKDYYTIHEIFITEAYGFSRMKRGAELMAHYRSLLELEREPLIIDCGANIGASSAYLSLVFPEAQILAVEPEPLNAHQHRLNCHRENVRLLEAAVGPTAGRLSLCVDDNPRAHRVEADGAGPVVRMLGMRDLLALYPDAQPFFAKIDIEGFEEQLFVDCDEWVEQFPVITVEPHDWMMPRTAKARNMLTAFAANDRDFVIDGENVVSISNTLL